MSACSAQPGRRGPGTSPGLNRRRALHRLSGALSSLGETRGYRIQEGQVLLIPQVCALLGQAEDPRSRWLFSSRSGSGIAYFVLLSRSHRVSSEVPSGSSRASRGEWQGSVNTEHSIQHVLGTPLPWCTPDHLPPPPRPGPSTYTVGTRYWLVILN